MAFNMKPGRSPFQQTGHGLPSAFLQKTKNAISGFNSREEAQAAADAEVNKMKEESVKNKPLTGSKDIRNFNSEKEFTIPAERKVERKVVPGTKEYDKWAKAVKKNPDIEKKFLSTSGKVKASASVAGEDKPELTTTPPKNPVSGTPSQKIYTIEGTRGYAGEQNKGKTGHRGLVTLNEGRANKEITFTENWNKRINKEYAQAKEGDAAARGLTGKGLERRNRIVEERRKALTREMPIIKVTEADKGTAVRAANAMNKANWESNIEKNKAEGINTLVFQKKSENKKISAKKAPTKQMKSNKKTPAKMKKC